MLTCATFSESLNQVAGNMGPGNYSCIVVRKWKNQKRQPRCVNVMLMHYPPAYY